MISPPLVPWWVGVFRASRGRESLALSLCAVLFRASRGQESLGLFMRVCALRVSRQSQLTTTLRKVLPRTFTPLLTPVVQIRLKLISLLKSRSVTCP